MSERGMILALQRIHDDPGFTERVAQDPEGTLGIYDLDETECNTLINAVKSNDTSAIQQMATTVGIDWHGGVITGVGALSDNEVSMEASPPPTGAMAPSGVTETAPGSDTSVSSNTHGTGALPGDGYEGVKPARPAGT